MKAVTASRYVAVQVHLLGACPPEGGDRSDPVFLKPASAKWLAHELVTDHVAEVLELSPTSSDLT
jgi:hypothetical protein